VDRHQLDRHQLDRNLLDRYQLDRHVVDRHQLDRHVVDRHQLDRHQLDHQRLVRDQLDGRRLVRRLGSVTRAERDLLLDEAASVRLGIMSSAPPRRARSAGYPWRIRIYIVVVTLAALVTAPAAALLTGNDTRAPAWVVPVLLALMVESELLRITFKYRDSQDSFTLIETALAPVLLACSGWQLLVVVGGGLTVAWVIKGRDPLKSVFNVGQWLLAASLAGITFNALRAGEGVGPDNALALLVALLVATLVNQLAIAGILKLVTGHAFGRAVVGHDAIVGKLIGPSGCIMLGMTVAGGYAWSPWTLVFAFITQPLAHWASRGYAAGRADRQRLGGLYQATHALAFSLDRREAFSRLLAESRSAFEVHAAELVLFDERSPAARTPWTEGRTRRATTGADPEGETVEVHSYGEDEQYVVDRRRHRLAELMRDAAEPVRLSGRRLDAHLQAALAVEGHHQAIVAPMRSGITPLGVLFLYDRSGMEGYEEGELAVAAALAAEVVSYLERGELVQTVLEEQRKLAEIVENTSDGIFSLDGTGRIRSWNPGLAQMTGYSSEEMVDTKHLGLLRMRDADGADVLLERWAQVDNDPPDEVQILDASGQPLWLACSYSRIAAAEGRPAVLVVVARNVTQARELDRLKDDFVAIVGHELRTPLAAIKGWSSTLLSRGERMREDQRLTALQAVLGQAQRLEQLVLNILESSRIEARVAGQESAVVDVSSAAVKVVDEVVSARPDRVVHLIAPDHGCTVRGSTVWLERALANLVGNAVKYSPGGGTVRCTVASDGDGHALVRVSDEGIGIAAADMPRLFTRFGRVVTRENSHIAGTGLGLYLSRELARMHGGDITVESEPGRGSVFTLRLPVSDVDVLAPAVEQ
jgi:PAS domain S-box-containing protein